MFRISVTLRVFALTTTLLFSATGSPARAQGAYVPPKRFEITPFGSYQWGGSFDTQGFSNILAGEIAENASFSWGGILSFLAAGNSAVELYYLRQDTKVDFKPNTGESREVGDFANNYVQLGVRQGLPKTEGLAPFITASMGINVLDAKNSDSSTRFAWSLGGGAKYMVPNNPRLGFRLDIKWMVTPVPSGTYGTWCDYWGCYVTSGTDWLHQGSAGLGLILAF
jgi:opacity protein-like surface antigen